MAQTLPTVTVPAGTLHKVRAIDAAVLAGFASSNGEARRLIVGGGFKINDKTEYDPIHATSWRGRDNEGVIKLSLGRKRHVLLKPV